MGWPRDRSEPDPRMDSKGYKGSSVVLITFSLSLRHGQRSNKNTRVYLFRFDFILAVSENFFCENRMNEM
ncbi:hypothetical protein QR685DRAFT_529915 [Neurospora intermedia]|uniref:Uncharacterized protein n=1 Tax=Neurospora intermedia TaxID=5142 RepID=A0ABR3D910_NEUIN